MGNTESEKKLIAIYGLPSNLEIRPEALELVEQSKQKFESGNIEEAEILLEAALIADPFIFLGHNMPNPIPVTLGSKSTVNRPLSDTEQL